MFGAFANRLADLPAVPPALLHWQPTDATFPVPNLGTLGSAGDLTTKGAAATISGGGIIIPNTSASWIRTEADGTPLEWASPALTMSVWLNRTGDSFGAYGNILAKASRPSSWTAPFTQAQLTLDVVGETNRTSTALRTSTSATPIYETAHSARPPVGQWTHLATVYDGTALKLYMGGIEVASSTPANLWAPEWAFHGPWFLGSNAAVGSGAAEGCPGTYHDIRVFDVALSAGQVRKLKSISPV